MNTEILVDDINNFVDERLNKELWTQDGENTKYSLEIKSLIDIAENTLNKDSNILRLIYELIDSYEGQVYKMQNKAYKVGFKDGLNIKNVF